MIRTVIATDITKLGNEKLILLRYNSDNIESRWGDGEVGETVDLIEGRLWLEKRRLVKGSWRIVAKNILDKK